MPKIKAAAILTVCIVVAAGLGYYIMTREEGPGEGGPGWREVSAGWIKNWIVYADMPRYPYPECVRTTTSYQRDPETEMTLLMYRCTASADNFTNFYRTEMPNHGWTLVEEEAGIIKYEGVFDGQELRAWVYYADQKEGYSEITVAYGLKDPTSQPDTTQISASEFENMLDLLSEVPSSYTIENMPFVYGENALGCMDSAEMISIMYDNSDWDPTDFFGYRYNGMVVDYALWMATPLNMGYTGVAAAILPYQIASIASPGYYYYWLSDVEEGFAYLKRIIASGHPVCVAVSPDSLATDIQNAGLPEPAWHIWDWMVVSGYDEDNVYLHVPLLPGTCERYGQGYVDNIAPLAQYLPVKIGRFKDGWDNMNCAMKVPVKTHEAKSVQEILDELKGLAKLNPREIRDGYVYVDISTVGEYYSDGYGTFAKGRRALSRFLKKQGLDELADEYTRISKIYFDLDQKEYFESLKDNYEALRNIYTAGADNEENLIATWDSLVP